MTFSRNKIVYNILVGCDNGIWGGYSYETEILSNRISNNKVGIAIEHGQKNVITNNEMYNNGTAIKLWARASQPADWGYAKYRDTRSVNYVIEKNDLRSNKLNYDLKKTDSIRIDSTPPQLHFLDTVMDYNNAYGDRSAIRITEWGPYNYNYPLLWRSNPVDTSGLLKFKLFGPDGKWKLIRSKGVSGISKSTGKFPDSITAKLTGEGDGDYFIQLEYVGEKEFTDIFGNKVSAGKPTLFEFRKADVKLNWSVNWYAWDSTRNPVKNQDMIYENAENEPVMQQETKELNYAWWGGLTIQDKKIEQFQTMAWSEVKLEGGKYELAVTWDDAVRVFVDNELIVDEWNPSKYKFDESPNKRVRLELKPGMHEMRVQHVELGGFATLSVKLKKL